MQLSRERVVPVRHEITSRGFSSSKHVEKAPESFHLAGGEFALAWRENGDEQLRDKLTSVQGKGQVEQRLGQGFGSCPACFRHRGGRRLRLDLKPNQYRPPGRKVGL